jgi:hypothetical protein
MGIKKKWFADKQAAFVKLREDVGQNNVRIYDVGEYAENYSLQVHPASILSKFSHMEVAISGDPSSGNDWMLIAGYRVGSDGKTKVYDVDPILTVLDSDSGTSHPSGVIAYHRNYSGRTTEIEGFDGYSDHDTVCALRKNLNVGVIPLASGSPTTLGALSYMHGLYMGDFVNDEIESDEIESDET